MGRPVHLPARVLVRTDVDYTSMRASDFSAQDELTRPLAFIQFAAREKCREAFEEVFGFDFFQFRAEMKASSEESMRCLVGVRTSVGFTDFEAWFDNPEDELIFPIDDDDLFHPELAAFAELPSEADLVVWEWVGLGFHPWGKSPALHHYDLPSLFSNNWAVKKSFLRRALPPDEARRFLSDHGAAHELMLKHIGLEAKPGWTGTFAAMLTELAHPSVHFEKRQLGVQYLHPASLYLLAVTAQVTDLRARLQELDLESIVPLSDALAWARPSVDRYHALLGRLAESRKRRQG